MKITIPKNRSILESSKHVTYIATITSSYHCAAKGTIKGLNKYFFPRMLRSCGHRGSLNASYGEVPRHSHHQHLRTLLGHFNWKRKTNVHFQLSGLSVYSCVHLGCLGMYPLHLLLRAPAEDPSNIMHKYTTGSAERRGWQEMQLNPSGCRTEIFSSGKKGCRLHWNASSKSLFSHIFMWKLTFFCFYISEVKSDFFKHMSIK